MSSDINTFELKPETDLDIDLNNMQEEFRRIGALIYRYSEKKAELVESYNNSKCVLNEIKGQKYKYLKTSGTKITENHIEAEIDSDREVIVQYFKLHSIERDLETIKGFIEALKAKKDALIQLSADARIERK